MIRVSVSLIEKREGKELPLGGASVMALPGGKGVVSIGKKEGARLLEGVQFEAESMLDATEERVDLRFFFEQKDGLETGTSKNVTLKAGGKAVEIPLKNQSVLRVKASVE